jgi:hypothetical protein
MFTCNLYLTKIPIDNDGLHRPNPDDAWPIVHWPMGLAITAGCDTAWIQTRVSGVTPLALRCSALDRCATRETPNMLMADTRCIIQHIFSIHGVHVVTFRRYLGLKQQAARLNLFPLSITNQSILNRTFPCAYNTKHHVVHQYHTSPSPLAHMYRPGFKNYSKFNFK